MGAGKGYGKTILFGEHFVVYGLPAIASALGAFTTADVKVTKGSGWTVDDQRPATPGYKKKKYDESMQSIINVINHLKIDIVTQISGCSRKIAEIVVDVARQIRKQAIHDYSITKIFSTCLIVNFCMLVSKMPPKYIKHNRDFHAPVSY